MEHNGIKMKKLKQDKITWKDFCKLIGMHFFNIKEGELKWQN